MKRATSEGFMKKDPTLVMVANAAKGWADKKAGGKAKDYSTAVKKFSKQLKTRGEY